MKRARKRTIERKANRELEKRLGKARREAAAKRGAHNLCLCSDDERQYLSEAEAAADSSAAAMVCAECGKEKLRVPIIVNKTLSDNERLAIRGILK
jgi:hypothetical protein